VAGNLADVSGGAGRTGTAPMGREFRGRQLRAGQKRGPAVGPTRRGTCLPAGRRARSGWWWSTARVYLTTRSRVVEKAPGFGLAPREHAPRGHARPDLRGGEGAATDLRQSGRQHRLAPAARGARHRSDRPGTASSPTPRSGSAKAAPVPTTVDHGADLRLDRQLAASGGALGTESPNLQRLLSSRLHHDRAQAVMKPLLVVERQPYQRTPEPADASLDACVGRLPSAIQSPGPTGCAPSVLGSGGAVGSPATHLCLRAHAPAAFTLRAMVSPWQPRTDRSAARLRSRAASSVSDLRGGLHARSWPRSTLPPACTHSYAPSGPAPSTPSVSAGLAQRWQSALLDARIPFARPTPVPAHEPPVRHQADSALPEKLVTAGSVFPQRVQPALLWSVQALTPENQERPLSPRRAASGLRARVRQFPRSADGNTSCPSPRAACLRSLSPRADPCSTSSIRPAP
jgi:hypothetical protein